MHQPAGHEAEQRGHLAQMVGQRLALGRELTHVAAGAEVLALAAQQDGAQGAFSLQRAHRLGKGFEQLAVERVGGLGTIQAKAGDAVLEVEQNGVGHQAMILSAPTLCPDTLKE